MSPLPLSTVTNRGTPGLSHLGCPRLVQSEAPTDPAVDVPSGLAPRPAAFVTGESPMGEKDLFRAADLAKNAGPTAQSGSAPSLRTCGPGAGSEGTQERTRRLNPLIPSQRNSAVKPSIAG